MSNFTPLVNQEFEFEGDTIKVTFSRLLRKHMLAAMPLMKKLADAQDKEDEQGKQDVINDILNEIVDVIPEYVKSFEGLNDAEGDAISIETVCSEFYFMKLAAEITTSVLVASSGTEGKA
jgi:hypothetical protein